MSNPYIQFELDAAKKGPTLASALKISLSTALGGLVRLWLHVYGADKGDTVSAFYLRSFFEIDDAGRISEALCELGFVEPADDGGWRVRGAGRYTRLSEIRSKAGKAGREKQLAGPSRRQTPGKNQKPDALPGQTPGKSGKRPTLPGQDAGKTGDEPRLPGQVRALDPRSEISSPYGEERSRRDGRSARRFRKPAPTPDGARATKREDIVDPPPPPQRPPKPPPLKPGTPEYAQAVREDDWEALGWEPMR